MIFEENVLKKAKKRENYTKKRKVEDLRNSNEKKMDLSVDIPCMD